MTTEPYPLPAAAEGLMSRSFSRVPAIGLFKLVLQVPYLLALAVTLVAGLSTGCQTYKNQSRNMTLSWVSGNVDQAAKEFGEKAESKSGGKDAIIWHLEAGTAYRAAGKYEESNRHFDAAASKIDDYEQKAKVSISREAGAIMSNQQNLPYEGKPHDKIMLHTYRALNYLALGDIEKARPEIIRAYQRQQDAVEENARRIEKAKEEEEKHKDKEAIGKAKADPKFASEVEGVTKDVEGFKFYADYVNPFTVYLDGLYFLHAGSGNSDLEHAVKSLNRVIEVSGGNKFIAADIAAANGAGSTAPCTYILFETGQAASLDQVRIDIPIIISKVSYVGAAFPKLARHGGEAPALSVKAGEVQETTLPLASMDSIIALDFKNEYPTIVTKTVISTVAKAVAAYAINEQGRKQGGTFGIFTQIATAVTQAAMNIADTRTWTTLPKEFQVACVPTPADRTLTLSTGGAAPVEVKLLDGKVNVVYAKSITATSPLLVNQFILKQ